MLLLGIVIGILVGAAATYFGLASQLAEQSKQIERLQRDARDMELAFSDQRQGWLADGRGEEVQRLTNQRVSGIAEIAKLKAELAESQAEVILAREAALRHPGSVLGASPAASIPLNAPQTTPPPKPASLNDEPVVESSLGRILDPWGEASEEVQLDDNIPVGASEPQPSLAATRVGVAEAGVAEAGAISEVSAGADPREAELSDAAVLEAERLDGAAMDQEDPGALSDTQADPQVVLQAHPQTTDLQAELSTAKAGAIALCQAATTNTSPDAVRKLLPPLGQLSMDENPELRREAIAALGKLRTPGSLPFLRRGLQDPDVTVAAAASEAIASFKGYRSKLINKTGRKQLRKKKHLKRIAQRRMR